ncbi:sulfur carrier protein ThiS [Celerinatantimonas yamalensis]|uniref:Sulfur carrier protein ThiS n=1 Tax=Celerinatantimonas yamalensis TaxID=559956 RepID=A0ABW9GB81_9GAMM
MYITLNQQPVEVADGSSLAQLAEQLRLSQAGFAFAIDGEVIVQSRWRDYPLRAQQSISVFTAIAGG